MFQNFWEFHKSHVPHTFSIPVPTGTSICIGEALKNETQWEFLFTINLYLHKIAFAYALLDRCCCAIICRQIIARQSLPVVVSHQSQTGNACIIAQKIYTSNLNSRFKFRKTEPIESTLSDYLIREDCNLVVKSLFLILIYIGAMRAGLCYYYQSYTISHVLG